MDRKVKYRGWPPITKKEFKEQIEKSGGDLTWFAHRRWPEWERSGMRTHPYLSWRVEQEVYIHYNQDNGGHRIKRVTPKIVQKVKAGRLRAALEGEWMEQ